MTVNRFRQLFNWKPSLSFWSKFIGKAKKERKKEVSTSRKHRTWQHAEILAREYQFCLGSYLYSLFVSFVVTESRCLLRAIQVRLSAISCIYRLWDIRYTGRMPYYTIGRVLPRVYIRLSIIQTPCNNSFTITKYSPTFFPTLFIFKVKYIPLKINKVRMCAQKSILLNLISEHNQNTIMFVNFNSYSL